MSVLAYISHETGDLSQYTSTVTDGGDLSVAAGAALIGSYGLSALIDDTAAIYGQLNLGAADTSGAARWRFYVDPNSLTMGDFEIFDICTLQNSAGSDVAAVRLYGESGSYWLHAGLYADDLVLTSNDTPLADTSHYVEFLAQRASSAVASDGSLTAWIDGVQAFTVTGIDNYDLFNNFLSVRLGAPAGVDAGTSGTLYLDDLIVNNDGSEIGPAVPATVALDVAAATASGVALTVVPGAVTKALDTATATAPGVALTVVPGAVSTALAVAALTASGQALTVVPGAATTALDTATLAASGVALAVVPGAVTKALDTATLAAGGVALTVVPGAATTALDTATLAASGVALTVVPGAVSTALDTGAVVASGVALAVVPGAVTLALAVAALRVTGINLLDVKRDRRIRPGAGARTIIPGSESRTTAVPGRTRTITVEAE